MKTQAKIDKSKWGPGPWQSEPDRIEFEYLGFPCLMRRTDMGVWCGYVAVPPTHPAYGQYFDKVDVDVHGGLTYSDACQGEICHVPKPGEPDNVWWLGFDCAHYNDAMPGINEYGIDRIPGQNYKDVEFVRKEIESMAKQLSLMENPL